MFFTPCDQQNCSSQHYLNRDQFLSDLNQIVENSITYNGCSSPYTQTAQLMRDVELKLLEQVNSTSMTAFYVNACNNCNQKYSAIIV